jgi:acyl carrier protein
MITKRLGEKMPASDQDTRVVWETLWQSLDGSRYDIDALQERARNDSHFVDDIGIDSLDLLEFYLRLDEKFNVDLAEEDYPQLISVAAIANHLKDRAAQP